MASFLYILLVLLLILLIRDEVPHPSKKKDSLLVEASNQGHILHETTKELDESLIESGIDAWMTDEKRTRMLDEIRLLIPWSDKIPDKDYTKDEEFCRQHPCDFMEPYLSRGGNVIYTCANSEMWERWGIKEEILKNLNEKSKPLCARCSGISCKGSRKKEANKHPVLYK